jgi:predicted dehydrogenase
MGEGRIRIGVAGVGFGAMVHIPAFQSEGLEVVAVSARRLARAEEAAQRFAIPHAFDDFAAMLALPGLDAVSIVTPPATHRQLVTQALAAGKHVICEKPFTLDAGEADELRKTAAASGLTTMVAHEFRFASARRRAKELIAEGYVGTPQFVRADMVLPGPGSAARRAGPAPFNPARDRAALGAGLLFSLGSHYLDGLIDWFGPVATVSAELVNLSPERLADSGMVMSDADNLYLLHLRFQSGVIAEVCGGSGLPFGTGASIEVYGTEGTLVTPQGQGWNPPSHGQLLGAKRGAAGLEPLGIPPRLEPFVDDRDDRLMPFRLLVREFLRGIETATSPSPNFEDAYLCQLVLDAARASSASGRRIDIGS